ncbi:hypothetical protein V8E36_001059 [Tilletia maclaganii]
MADPPGEASDLARLTALLETNNILLKGMDARQSGMDTRLLKLEMELAELRIRQNQQPTATRGPSPIAMTTPRVVSAATLPDTPDAYAFRPGREPATGVRPGLTPSTPQIRGASGFIVPMAPKRQSEPVVQADAGKELPRHYYEEFPQFNVHPTPEQRVAATKRASEENSPSVIRRKAQLWDTCLENAEREFSGEPAEVIVCEAERALSKHWMDVRKDRICRSFDHDHPVDGSKVESRHDASRPRINKAAISRITKLTHSNYNTWVSEIIGLISPIAHAAEILEGIQHGEGYDPAAPNEVTDKYDAWLDLELGALIAGSVSEECRGYIFSRQSAGECRGSIYWRDIKTILLRNDGLGKANILEQVISELQRSTEGVRTYAERMRALYIKSAASQGNGYTFDQALTYLDSAEAAAKHDQSQGKLPILSRPTANVASTDGKRPYQLKVIGHTKGSQGRFNGECHNCGKYRHKKEDCRLLNQQIDSGQIKPDATKANLVQHEDDEVDNEHDFEDAQSDVEGDIYELVGENGEVIQARLVTGPVDNSARANIATAMTPSAAKATAERALAPETTAPSTAHLPQKAVKAIIDSGATHHC